MSYSSGQANGNKPGEPTTGCRLMTIRPFMCRRSSAPTRRPIAGWPTIGWPPSQRIASPHAAAKTRPRPWKWKWLSGAPVLLADALYFHSKSAGIRWKASESCTFWYNPSPKTVPRGERGAATPTIGDTCRALIMKHFCKSLCEIASSELGTDRIELENACILEGGRPRPPSAFDGGRGRPPSKRRMILKLIADHCCQYGGNGPRCGPYTNGALLFKLWLIGLLLLIVGADA